MSDADVVLTYTIQIARNGDITNDIQTHGNSFAAIYKAFHDIKHEVDRQIAQRRVCPFNPINGPLPEEFRHEQNSN